MATAESIQEVAEQLGLTMHAEFVPWSKSRNSGEKHPSLNWKISLSKNGKVFLTTDYSAGCGHCPSYKAPVKDLGNANSIMRAEFIERECETGHRALSIVGSVAQSMGMPIRPEFADVLHSLASDASVIDYGSFEDWAREFGYDTDSRKAETIYRACLEIALKLRNALGDEGLMTLQDACQGY